MRPKSMILIVIAMGCGLVASIAISQVLDQNANQTTVATQKIFVALQDTDLGVALTAEMLKLEEWPSDRVPPGAITTLEEVEGFRSRQRLFQGEAILKAKLIDPNDFVVLQDLMFASFNTVDGTLLAVTTLVIAAATLVTARLSTTLDVMALGRDTAISLGLAHRRVTLQVLALCALFVAVSTALVGPVTFFGLIVASLARTLVGSRHHAVTLLVASLLGVIALAGGQTILEHGLGYDAALGMVVEFVGGLVLLALLLKKGTA